MNKVFSNQRTSVPSADITKFQASTFYAGSYSFKQPSSIDKKSVNSKIMRARAAVHQVSNQETEGNAYFFLRRTKVKGESSNRSIVDSSNQSRINNTSLVNQYKNQVHEVEAPKVEPNVYSDQNDRKESPKTKTKLKQTFRKDEQIFTCFSRTYK